MRRWNFITLLLLTVAAAFATAYWVGYRITLAQVAARGETSLTLASERLKLQLDRFRFLPAVLARDAMVKNAVSRPPGIETNTHLQRISDTSGALDIYVMDVQGTTVAASNWELERSFLGKNYAWRPYFQRAVQGGLGYYHAVGSASNQRGFYFSHPILNETSQIGGVVAVKVDLEKIESAWSSDAHSIFFSDENGVIFLANRQLLVLRKLDDRAIDDPDRYAGRTLSPMPEISKSQIGAYEVWAPGNLTDLPQEALFLSRRIPTLAMTAHVLISTSQVRNVALLWGGLAAALAGGIWLLVGILLQRRKALSSQLAAEENARNLLEEKVEERTQALEQAQADLIQAGKLSALGEMSAGISHELNQPLAAIQSLADNAEILLERGNHAELGRNLANISSLTGRMGRIIRNLRTFARKEGETPVNVDLVTIINDALAITAPKSTESGTVISWDPPKQLMVRGGPVRLQQVIVNLVLNAIDAMQGQPDKRIHIEAFVDSDTTLLNVRDNGPGIQLPDKIFDPFYSTKTVGEGLGLGLSISYGIVQSFGGSISGQNHPDGGAVFSVELKTATTGAT